MAKRLVAKVDEYEKDGQTKGKYVEIGVILSNDNGEYALLDPTINLAGVLQKQNMLGRKKQQQPRDMVAVSIFDNNNQQQQSPQQQQGGWGQPHQQQQQQPQQQYNEPPMDFDDDIPFAPIGLMYNNALIHCI